MIDLKIKKILVTGGAGFLGSHVIQGLINRGVPQENIFAPRSKDFDLRKWHHCEEVVRKQNIVFDLAVVAGDLEVRSRMPGKLFYDNLMMGVQLIEAARRASVEKIITIGSAVEYPERAPTPLKEKDLWNGEQSPLNIPYGLAKKILLVQGQAYRKEYGLNTIHLLPTNIYGPRERAESGYLMPSLIQKAIDAKRGGKNFIDAWGTGKPIRDFLYVDDAVNGILLAAERYDESDPVNLGTGVGISVKELVAMICSAAGFSGEVHWDASKPDGQLERVMDTKRAEEKFGFIARISLGEGLKKTIEWHQSHSPVT